MEQQQQRTDQGVNSASRNAKTTPWTIAAQNSANAAALASVKAARQQTGSHHPRVDPPVGCPLTDDEIVSNRKESIAMLRKALEHPSETAGGLCSSVEDDDDDGEEDEPGDYETEDKGSDPETRRRRKRYRQSYMPSKDSFVEKYLKRMKEEIQKSPPPKGRHWFPPTHDPVATGIGINPTPMLFYTGNIWVYYWDPETQYKE
jgi:hypothetical protein